MRSTSYAGGLSPPSIVQLHTTFFPNFSWIPRFLFDDLYKYLFLYFCFIPVYRLRICFVHMHDGTYQVQCNPFQACEPAANSFIYCE